MTLTHHPRTDKPFLFDPAVLLARAEASREAYRDADPFPHGVFDDFVPEEVVDGLLEEFPSPRDLDWQSFRAEQEVKLATNDGEDMGPLTRHMIAQFQSPALLQFLETLTGIEGLIPDPYLTGGGLHQIERGGFLNVHADFNWCNKLKLHRRVNLIFYLNRDWKEEYGGHLELWDKPMKNCRARVLPIANRAAIFSTTSTSWHGHPDPLTCPEGNSRKSIAFYYYTADRPRHEKHGRHTTIFRSRPGDAAKNPNGSWLQRMIAPFRGQ